MTKLVRIENADLSSFELNVRIQFKVDGEWVDSDEVKKPLGPTQQLSEYIWKEKRLIIEEGSVINSSWRKNNE